MSENSDANEGKKRSAKESNGDDGRKIDGGDHSDDHELHIWTERGRRKKMRNMFEDLHSLLPHLPSKTDKSSIVDEAISRIKKLEQILKTLQKQKLQGLDPSTLVIQSREGFIADHQDSTSESVQNPTHVPSFFKTWTSPNLTLNVCGNDAQISICSTWKPCLLTKICFVVEKNQLEVLSAHVSTDTYQQCMYMIHARANGGSEEAYTVEEKCKQAAAEIMLWVNS